jgi:hypothetical protein
MTYDTNTKPSTEKNRLEILSLRPVGGTGQLRAIARVRIGVLAIDQVRILQADNGDIWASMPQLALRAKADGGGAGFRSIIEFLDYGVWVELREMLIAAYRELEGGR